MRVGAFLAVAAATASLAAPCPSMAQDAPSPPVGASAQVLRGASLSQENCALCHGATGRDAKVFPRPIWGPGHDIAKFGNSKGLFDYMQLLMPFDNPAKIDDGAKTAVVAYMLVRNGNLKPAQSLPAGGDQTPIK